MRQAMLSLFLTLVLAALAGCGNQVGASRANTSPAATLVEQEEVLIPVEAMKPVRGDIASYFETTTRVQAEQHVEVVSKGAGECIEVLVDEGNSVQAGDVIARLDTKQIVAQINQTKVNVQQAKFQMDKAQEQLKEGIISPFETEQARFAHEQAIAALDLLQLQLEHQTIVSPISGMITMRSIQKGQVVAMGMPIFRIVDPASYFLPINPPEKELPRLKLDQLAKVSIDAVEGQEFDAHVRRINPSVDPMSGTVKVVLDFDEAARPHLREGSFARVRLIMETHSNALMVPKDALVEENARKYLMIVTEAAPETAAETPEAAPAGEKRLVADRVEVETGLEDSNNIEILSGIADDMLVVTLGQHTLKAGSLVKITTAEEEISARASITPEEALAMARDERRSVQAAARSAS